MRFRSHNDGILFEDGISYTADELDSINQARCQGEQLLTIHMAKKLFDGTIRNGLTTEQGSAR